MFTTVPIRIRNPSRDVMLMVTPVSFSSPKEPTRLRPILMTSLTTILSMIPMALAMGSSGSTTQGLAVVNIGGLSAGILVALFLLPVYYALMNGDRKRVVLDL